MLSAMNALLQPIGNGFLARCRGKDEWSIAYGFDKWAKPGSNCIELPAQLLELTLGWEGKT